MNLHISKKIFNSAYLPYLNSDKKYNVFYGGSGSGKSVFVAQALLIKACNSVRKILIIRKTLVSQKDSCWQLFLDLLSQWKIYNLCIVKKSDYEIDLPNGSKILFKGLDDPEKIKSIVGITDCWCEEATELTEDDFTQLTLRLRSADDTQFYISYNPTSKANWVYKRWHSPEAIIGDDTVVVKTTYKDNRFLPQHYIETLEQMIRTNPTYYKIYAQGEFCTLDKLVYNNWHISDFNPSEINGTRLAGLDFGYTNDPTAIVQSIATADNKLYIYKEYTEKGLTNQQIATVLKQLGVSKDVIIADSAEPKSIREIQLAGIPRIRESVKGPDSINQGIQLLQQYEIIVSPECTNVIEELENYSWQKDKQTGEYINKPIDLYNHCLDALRYSIQLLGKGKLKSFNKNILGV